MILKWPVENHMEENCFFYVDDKTKHGFVIDPGAQADVLLEVIRSNNWTIEKILLTHGHFDHIGAADEIRKSLGIAIFAHEKSEEYLQDPRKNLSIHYAPQIRLDDVKSLKDGEVISLEGNSDFFLKVIHTPGHTTDSVIYYSQKDKLAFSGDTIFKGSFGNYTFPGGNFYQLCDSIKKKVFTLADDTILYPGHMEQTTVGAELNQLDGMI